MSHDDHGNARAVDKTTRAILERLAEEAPDLEAILRRAIREDLVSKEVVDALELAARSINDDLIYALTVASRNINQDVADKLVTAGRLVENNVASSSETLAHAAESVAQATEQLKELSDALDADFGTRRQSQPALKASPQQRRRGPRMDEALAGSFVDTTYSTLLRVFLLGMGAGLLLIFAVQAFAIYWWTSG